MTRSELVGSITEKFPSLSRQSVEALSEFLMERESKTISAPPSERHAETKGTYDSVPKSDRIYWISKEDFDVIEVVVNVLSDLATGNKLGALKTLLVAFFSFRENRLEFSGKLADIIRALNKEPLSLAELEVQTGIAIPELESLLRTLGEVVAIRDERAELRA